MLYRFMILGSFNECKINAPATQFLIQGALQQWLGDLIEVEAAEVRGQEGNLYITVQYMVRRSQERQVARFER